MVSFHIDGIPDPLPIRDPRTGNVVDGYRVHVVSNETGARAVLEIPKHGFTPDAVRAAAEQALGQLDAALGQFSPPSQ